MDSQDLRGEGLDGWYPFNHPQFPCASSYTFGGTLLDDSGYYPWLLARIPARPGVYLVRALEPIGRWLGFSDILYVGRATGRRGLRGRLAGYVRSRLWQGRSPIWDAWEMMSGYEAFEIGWFVTQIQAEATWLERELMARYERALGELPPLNSRRG